MKLFNSNSRFARTSAVLLMAVSLSIAPMAFSKDRSENLAEKLELQASQTAAFNDVMASSGADMKAVREQMKDKMSAIMAARRTELSAVLDSEQLAEYDAIMEKRLERKHKHHGKKDRHSK